MNASQEKAWTTLADDLVIRVPARELSTSVHPDAHVDWAATFGREAPLFVEIGSGRGEALVALAEQHPEANVVAFEVFQPAVASPLGRINRHGVTNVRVVLANGVEGLEHLFAPATVAELWTFFPDPWHKARHHKRRLVGPELAGLGNPQRSSHPQICSRSPELIRFSVPALRGRSAGRVSNAGLHPPAPSRGRFCRRRPLSGKRLPRSGSPES